MICRRSNTITTPPDAGPTTERHLGIICGRRWQRINEPLSYVEPMNIPAMILAAFRLENGLSIADNSFGLTHSPHRPTPPSTPRNRATRAARPAARRASSASLRRARDSVPNRADPHVRTDTRADRPPRRSRPSRPSRALVVVVTASTRGTTGNRPSWWNTGSKTSGNDHDESMSCSALVSASKHTRGAVSSGRGVRKVVATAWTSALAVVYRCSTVWCTHVPPDATPAYPRV